MLCLLEDYATQPARRVQSCVHASHMFATCGILPYRVRIPVILSRLRERREGIPRYEQIPSTPLRGDEFEHVSAAIAHGVPLEVALDLIVQRTCDLLEVDQAAFFLAEGQGPSLRLAATNTGIPAQPVVLAPYEGVEG